MLGGEGTGQVGLVIYMPGGMGKRNPMGQPSRSEMW